MRKRNNKVSFLLTFAILLTAATAAFADGNWSKTIWVGNNSDSVGAALSSRFKVKVQNKKVDVVVYDVFIDWLPNAGEVLLPVTINRSDIVAGRPASIVWTGSYNGFVEEKESIFTGGERTAAMMFTTTKSPSGNKFYAAEGVVIWNEKTKRDRDRICIVWDSAMKSRVYVGLGFKELMKKFGIGDIPGYNVEDNHQGLLR